MVLMNQQIYISKDPSEDHNVEPIRVSYHRRNHYNSVKPLQGKFSIELRTSRIRAFRKKTSKGAVSLIQDTNGHSLRNKKNSDLP